MNPLRSHRAFGGEVVFASHPSSATQTRMNLSLFIPKQPPTSCLIWLSGLTCSEENFITKAAALEYLNQKQMMLVCPDTSPRGLKLPNEHQDWDFGSGASFYVNATSDGYRNHYQMATYIVNELYPYIAETYSMVGNIALSGHSMGGHGALTIGLNYPQLFTSISAFAPIVNPSQCPWGIKALTGYLGNKPEAWERYDACSLIAAGKRHPKAILISQGLNDEFLDAQLKTQHFIDICEQQGQALTVHFEHGYDHSYYFISSFIKRHIDFHLQT